MWENSSSNFLLNFTFNNFYDSAYNFHFISDHCKRNSVTSGKFLSVDMCSIVELKRTIFGFFISNGIVFSSIMNGKL